MTPPVLLSAPLILRQLQNEVAVSLVSSNEYFGQCLVNLVKILLVVCGFKKKCTLLAVYFMKHTD